MYTIGFVTEQEQIENRHVNYIKEKEWSVVQFNMAKLATIETEVDAIIIQEDTMPTTCCWLIELARHSNAPIYLLSKDNDSHSNIVYLQLGVEACFSEKIDSEELTLTLENLLTSYYMYRQQLGNTEIGTDTLQSLGLELVPTNSSVIIDGETEIILTKKEFQALEILYNNPSRAISYEEFMEKLWSKETEVGDKNYRIANIVFHLRNKIEQNSTNPRFIKTIRSKGYMLNTK
ncbi:hypothetical protein DOK67_0002047 [Enterococcus sp. DIV0212c]|uniref:winged helix-turn-helix domain-containing protein n=1 Tax=Enterococcus sp. DIV0212c TaxID=2230867 RepID=UPI001A9B059B|nr:winged helix-turn-helix domain-containing protein [Enterococcus sp. DIV0212c]MBO1354775.1 winged helix-turn-helix transcriptional regulator [Enterococcus sp. DIV0212c]